MCGIVGYVGPRQASPFLIEGLKRLEYRGYDSAGIATLSNGGFTIYRSPGKLGNLVEKLDGATVPGATGIGHTRWATHGRPTELNAHPQTDCSGKIVVVHNGIFENFAERKAELAKAGHTFRSETDTEVFAHEVEAAFHGDLLAAVRSAVRRLTGAYAVLVTSSREPGVLVAARSGPPIVLGLGQGENFVASDPVALVPWTRDVIFLEDGDIARVDAGGARVVNAEGDRLDRPVHRILWDAVAAEKGGYRHYMAKEIHEQPTAIAETLGGKVSLETGELYLDSPLLSKERVAEFDRVLLLACGTSWHAGLVGKFLIEGMARIPVEVDYGSEFRYRRPVVDARTLTVGISQSGETADTVAALSEARRAGSPIAAIVNAPGSQIARMVESVFPTHAGPEIGVASTKAFTTQLAVLYLVAAQLRSARGLAPVLSAEERLALAHLPRAVGGALAIEPELEELAREVPARARLPLSRPRPALPGGARGRAEAQGDLLHPRRGLSGGRDEARPDRADRREHAGRRSGAERRVAGEDAVEPAGGQVARRNRHRGRYPSRRGGRGDRRPRLLMPETIPELQPIISVVPLQLFAYHVAVRRGCDVDQPRNLAKSVTVE